MTHEYNYRDGDRREHKVFIRDRNLQTKRKMIQENPREVSLCAECAWNFYESPWHSIRRIDPYQLDFEVCRICRVRKGYTYMVEDLRKQRIRKEDIFIVRKEERT